MDFLKKLLAMRNAFGSVLIGLIFAVVGLIIFFSGASDGDIVPLVIAVAGIVLLAVGIRQVKKEAKAPASEKAQYDRVDRTQVAQKIAQTVEDPNEEQEEFVYHFTGKLNQSQIMKTAGGEVVYEAICEKMSLVKDTAYQFVDHLSGEESTKMISHTVTTSAGVREGFSVTTSSTFRVDGTPVWDVLAAMGYGFRFSMNGLAPHYEVQHWTKNAGFVESGGTGLMNPKYKDSALGKVPTKGIYRVKCRRSDVPGFFLICFALSRTDETLS